MDYDITLIKVDGIYKALVIDLNKVTNRLVHICENINKDLAYNEAVQFIRDLGAVVVETAHCH